MARRVLHLAPPAAGGMAAHLAILTRQLPAFGYRCVVNPAADPGADERPRGASVPRPGSVARPTGPWHPRDWRRLRAALAGAGVDLVHAHGYRAALLAAALSRGLARRAPLVVTLHGFVPRGADGLGWCWCRQRLARSVAAWIVVSNALAREVPAGAVPAVIYNGVDWRRFDRRARVAGAAPAAAAHAPVILCAGRLAPEKGHRVLLRALARTRVRGTVWLAGSGPLGPKLRRLCRQLGLDGRVRLLGFRPDLPALMRRAELFVLPSLREGLSTALVEAMGSGLICVASRTGGIPELAGKGRGYLVPPGDPQALAAALERASAGRAEARQRAARARAFARQLTARRMVETTCRVYGALLGRAAPGKGAPGP